MIGLISVPAMVLSEVVAGVMRSQSSAHPTTCHVAGHAIPFTNLNIIFAFGMAVRMFVTYIETTDAGRLEQGVPKMSLQTTCMLVCMLLTSPEARRWLPVVVPGGVPPSPAHGGGAGVLREAREENKDLQEEVARVEVETTTVAAARIIVVNPTE
jgi:hypothetical protein